MRISLTGSSGFIGSVIARQLAEAGHSVNALVRETSRRDHIEACVDRFIVSDQADESAWPELLEDSDCVIHNSVDWKPISGSRDLDRHLHSNLVGSIKLLHASAPRQFIFVSTIAVHHDMRPRWQGQIDEDHPMRPSMLYGAYKAAVEPHLWAAHFGEGRHTCALRPCGVYGLDPNLKRSHGYSIIEKIKRGEDINKAGGGKFVHVEDVAAAAVAAIGNPDAAGKPYNIVDCYARWADWAQMASELLNAGVNVDMSSPGEPKNKFSKKEVQSLGVPLNSGHEGIRRHLEQLIEKM